MAPQGRNKNKNNNEKLPFISKNTSGQRSWNSPMVGEPLELVSIPLNLAHRPMSNPTGTSSGHTLNSQFRSTKEAWSPARGHEVIGLPRSINSSPSSPFNYAFPGHKLKATPVESPLKRTPYKSPPGLSGRDVASAGPAYPSSYLGNTSSHEGHPNGGMSQQNDPLPLNHTTLKVGSQLEGGGGSSLLTKAPPPSYAHRSDAMVTPSTTTPGGPNASPSTQRKSSPNHSAASLIASLVLDAKSLANIR